MIGGKEGIGDGRDSDGHNHFLRLSFTLSRMLAVREVTLQQWKQWLHYFRVNCPDDAEPRGQTPGWAGITHTCCNPMKQ